MQEDINIEIQIDEIIEKVRTVEFLHGVPVSLPSETIELLRSGIRGAITQTLAEEREQLRERVGNKWKLAKFMHDRYEKYAFIFGWDTQEQTKVPFENLPEENKKTMLAVAQDILFSLQNITKKDS